MLFTASLNSGSNGNCYYIGNAAEAVLIDAGISRKETEKRMLRLGLCINNVKAIFISHEHADHIHGLETLSSKYNLPVYVSETTHKHGGLRINKNLAHYFSANERIQIGGLTVKAFSKLHDACDPYSFTVQQNDVCIGIFTDIGKACQQVIYHFRQCNAAFLEANYDAEMLAAGRYPIFLKRRISSGNGHLSNTAALELFCSHRSGRLTHLILSHLSANNNCPELVEKIFNQHASETKIIVASRYHETEVYCIQPSQLTDAEKIYYTQTAVQLSMF